MDFRKLALASLLLIPACAADDFSSDQDLGHDEHEIVGGTPEKIQDSPWQVSIFEPTPVEAPPDFFGHRCGGTILDEYHVLTARHCFAPPAPNADRLRSPKLFKVAAGFSKQSKRDAEAQIIEIDDVVPIADAWDGNVEQGSDILILRLAKPLKFNKKVQPIELVTLEDERDGVGVPGGPATVTGWGVVDPAVNVPSEKLLSVDLPIVPLEIAERISGKNLADDLIAAGGVTGKDSCFGDSGGPLVVKRGGKYLLAGVVSFGIDGNTTGTVACGGAGVPALYTRVASYADVIYQALCEDQKVLKKKNGIKGKTGAMQFISVHVPAGQREVNFNVFGGTGDADMFVRRGAKPSEDDFDCKSSAIGSSNETCNFAQPAAGTYWIGLLGFEDYADVKLRVNAYSEY